VICVGNLHSGGSGKTPLVISIADHFSSMKPVVLSRGYRSKGTGRVDLSVAEGPERFGDEPWMIARRLGCPVLVDANRQRALEMIERERIGELVLLDDGFQHFRVEPTVSLVAISADRPPKDSYCLPLGDLREPLVALRSAAAVVLTSGSDRDFSSEWRELLTATFPSVRLFRAIRRWEAPGPEGIGRLGAFCGIAGAERFFVDAAAHVAPLVLQKAFADHHAYSDEDIRNLVDNGRQCGVTHWITTEKDHAKVAARFQARGQTPLVARIKYELPEDFWYFLRSFLEQR
jgi:tetraacyldisaccharide 4'-kinase